MATVKAWVPVFVALSVSLALDVRLSVAAWMSVIRSGRLRAW